MILFLGPLVSLEIVGHEFTHLVVANNGHGGLTYQGESGALNESFADIFGMTIKYYTDSTKADWLIGEYVVLQPPYYLRNMSNPKTSSPPQPDTYLGIYWANTDNPSPYNDYGGVHNNNGVQNYWYYLISHGGSGTNYFGYSYNITGIGIWKAIQIAYSTLINYITPDESYTDIYQNSLQATEDLYGNPSIEYNTVRDAWYAVGMGEGGKPLPYCAGLTILTKTSDTLSDGSGNNDYTNFSNCGWLIKPAGADNITLNFTDFNTEKGHDFATVYDGMDTTDNVLLRWSGNTLPPKVKSSNGAMFIKFTSDNQNTESGWKANYTSAGNVQCQDTTILTDAAGTFDNGSGTADYSNNEDCFWRISPKNAISITLTFTEFDTEQDADFVTIYDGQSPTSPVLKRFSGSEIPPKITAQGGSMLVEFKTDYSNKFKGFKASYTSKINDGVSNLENNNSVILLTPNPTQGIFTIKTAKANMYMSVYDINGRCILPVVRLKNDNNIFNITDKPKGLYILKIFDDKSFYFGKLILY